MADNKPDRDINVKVTQEQVEAIHLWREADFDKKAEAWSADACLRIEEFFGAAATFLDACVGRNQLDRATAEKVKALYSMGADEAKRGIHERIAEARVTLSDYRDELRGEERNDG